MKEKRSYHPIEHNEADHLIGQEILCANEKEGLGYWAKLIKINKYSNFPYFCEIYYNKVQKGFKWIATI